MGPGYLRQENGNRTCEARDVRQETSDSYGTFSKIVIGDNFF